MQELILKRNDADKRVFELTGVGTLHWENKLRGHVTAEAATGTWELRRRGFLNGSTFALDTAGAEVAACWEREQGIHYGGRVLPLVHYVKEPYVLWDDHEGGRELVRYQDSNWRNTGTTVAVVEEEFIQREPLLLLYGCYAVNWLVGIGKGAGMATGGVVGGAPRRKKAADK